MSFKDEIKADVQEIFLNEMEFADEHLVNGKPMTVLIDESEIIELEIYKLAMYSIDTYARKFKSDGVSQDDMTSLYDTVKSAVAEVNTTSDKTEKLKADVIARLESAESAISNAFRE